MKAKREIARCMMAAVAAGLMMAVASQTDAKPLKVFILAGQSNIEGPARIETFDYIGDDPATAPMLKRMRGADGKPTVCEGAWISHLTGVGEKNLETTGNLPFVIGVMGVGGLKDESVDMVAFRRAMAAPVALPEFKGKAFAEANLKRLESRRP